MSTPACVLCSWVLGAVVSAPRTEYESVVVAPPLPGSMAGERDVSRDEAAALGAVTAADAVEQDVSVLAPSGARGERTFVLRGLDQRQTLVLVDGAPALSSFDGQLDLGGVPLWALDGAQVLRGGAVPPGTAGLGGVVSLRTRRPGTGPRLALWTETRWPGDVRGGAVHGGHVGSLRYTAYAGGEQLRGVPLPSSFVPVPLQLGGLRVGSDRRMLHAGGALRVEPAPGESFELRALGVDGAHGVPPGLEDPVPRFWRWNTWRSLMASLVHQHEGDVLVASSLHVHLLETVLDSYDDVSYTTQQTPRAFHSRYRDGTAAARVDVRRRWGASARFTAGVAATAQGDAHAERVASVEEQPAAPSLQRLMLTASPWMHIQGEAMSVRGMCDFSGEVPVQLPGAGGVSAMLGPRLAWRAAPAGSSWELNAALARRHRWPTLKERFVATGAFRLPNPGLRPEVGWMLDGAGMWRAGRILTATASLFAGQVDDLIERVIVAPGQDQMQNTGRARLVGGETSVLARGSGRFSLEVAYAFLYMRLSSSIAGWTTPPHRPRHQVRLGVVAWPWPWLELASFVRLVGRQQVQDPTTPASMAMLGAFVVVDARVELRLHDTVRVAVRASNVLDALYQTELGFPEAGRELWLGLTVLHGRL